MDNESIRHVVDAELRFVIFFGYFWGSGLEHYMAVVCKRSKGTSVLNSVETYYPP